ncbi:hypothetical protein Dda_5900 [Drechslerella dactyloides]|uniref:Uncharacterized protein n=1 Tax=Drechslerella dactyloides TaxID=74499 RepID=A0AAD6IUP8_DREDA|nr:hypothetical protein Dda_5900 [Drechslerella dactyloides]
MVHSAKSAESLPKKARQAHNNKVPPDAPRRNLSSFVMFANSDISSEWAKMNDDSKTPWKRAMTDDKERYKREMELYRKHGPHWVWVVGHKMRLELGLTDEDCTQLKWDSLTESRSDPGRSPEVAQKHIRLGNQPGARGTDDVPGNSLQQPQKSTHQMVPCGSSARGDLVDPESFVNSRAPAESIPTVRKSRSESPEIRRRSQPFIDGTMPDQNSPSQSSEASNFDDLDNPRSDALAFEDTGLADIFSPKVPTVQQRRPDPIPLQQPLRGNDITNRITNSHSAGQDFYPIWQPSIWDTRWRGYCPRKIDFATESASENVRSATPTLQDRNSRIDPWLDSSDDDISTDSHDSFDEIDISPNARNHNFGIQTDLRGGPPDGHNNPFHNLKPPSTKGASGKTPVRRNSGQRESWKRSLRRSGVQLREPAPLQEIAPVEASSQIAENVVEDTPEELTGLPPATSDSDSPLLRRIQHSFWAALGNTRERIQTAWGWSTTQRGVSTLVVLSWVILLILAQTNFLRVRNWEFLNPGLKDKNNRLILSGTRIDNDWRPDPRDIVKLMFSKNSSQTVMDSKILYHLQSIEERQGLLNKKTQKQLDDTTLVLDTMAREIKHLHIALSSLINGFGTKSSERSHTDVNLIVRLLCPEEFGIMGGTQGTRIRNCLKRRKAASLALRSRQHTTISNRMLTNILPYMDDVPPVTVTLGGGLILLVYAEVLAEWVTFRGNQKLRRVSQVIAVLLSASAIVVYPIRIFTRRIRRPKPVESSRQGFWLFSAVQNIFTAILKKMTDLLQSGPRRQAAEVERSLSWMETTKFTFSQTKDFASSLKFGDLKEYITGISLKDFLLGFSVPYTLTKLLVLYLIYAFITWIIPDVLSSTPVAVNPYNVSSLTFDVGPLTDFSNDWALRQKEWPNFLPNVANARPKKFAFYKEIDVDSNPYLCFQNVIIQKAPSQAAFARSTDAVANAGVRNAAKYGRDFFSLGIPIRVMVEMNHQLTKVHSIPLGSCRSVLKGEHFWMVARPPPAYPPQLVDEDMESFFLQWDEFVKTDLRSSSWLCHVIGQARVRTESSCDLEREENSGPEPPERKNSVLSSKRRKAPPSPLSHGDFSLGITVQKIVLLEKVNVEAPTVAEMEEQRRMELDSEICLEVKL